MPAGGYRAGMEHDVVWDHGELYRGDEYLGISRGGVRFASNTEMIYPDHDGKTSEVEGLHRIAGWDPRIKGTFFWSASDRLDWYEPGLTVDTTGLPSPVTSRRTPKRARVLLDRNDYLNDLRMVGYRIATNGNEVIEQIRFPKALPVSFEVVGQDKDVWIVEAEFRCVLDKDDAAIDPNQCPYVYETLSAIS